MQPLASSEVSEVAAGLSDGGPVVMGHLSQRPWLPLPSLLVEEDAVGNLATMRAMASGVNQVLRRVET